MLFNFGYDPDSPSIFESRIGGQIGSSGIDITLSGGSGGPSGTFTSAPAPPVTTAGLSGINVMGLFIIGLLIWIATQ